MAMEWKGDEYMAALQKKMGDNLEVAAIYFKGKVKEAINTSQPYERYSGKSGVYYEGKSPSMPGAPPKKISGFLQRSIAHAMSADRTRAFVGSGLEYARFLELGTSKMQARPFFRTTLLVHQATIAKIVATGQA